ncbi:hypothetical protein [Trinickia symbiotica]|nr:hypothetical protein [Trinickia symbiotica]
MAWFDQNASARRFEASPTADESLGRFINVIDGLTTSKRERLHHIYLFATERPDVRLVIVMYYDAGRATYDVIDGPVFTAANINQICSVLHVADNFADGRPLAAGDNPKVFYCGKPAPRTDDIHPFDAAKELVDHFLKSSNCKINSHGFLRLFDAE